MIVLYSTETNEIELQGNKKDLKDFSDKLLKNNEYINLNFENILSDFYDIVLKKIYIEHSKNSKLKIFVDKQIISFIGDIEYLTGLSEYIESFLSLQENNSHIHIEYYDNHPFLDKSSLPFVIDLID